MNILILNGSPKGPNSITLHTALYLKALHPEQNFEILHVGQRIKVFEKDFSEAGKALEKVDVVLFVYPVYTFIAPYQLHRFLELIRENGHPIGYIISGIYSREENLHTIIEARSQVGGTYLTGIVTDESDKPVSVETKIDNLVRNMTFALENRITAPMNFYGVGGIRIFRDLIYVMRGLMQADHRFYKTHGIYNDLPHRQKKRIIQMMFVGLLMKFPSVQKKMKSQMNRFIIEPYRKVIFQAETRNNKK